MSLQVDRTRSMLRFTAEGQCKYSSWEGVQETEDINVRPGTEKRIG